MRGLFWAYGSFAGARLASLLTTAILARLLAPRDFGVIALAMTFIAFLDMLQGLGVSDALVVGDVADLAEPDTAFMVGSVVGLLLWLGSAALGPLASSLFHEHRLILIMPAIGATFFIRGLGSTHFSLATRQINFRSRTISELGDALLRGVVGVTLALAGAGVWSLVAGYLAGAVAMTLLLWWLVPWRPRLRAHRRHLRRLLGFGGALTGVGIMGAFLAQFDNGVIGHVLGSTQLGYYSIANRLPYLFIISLASAGGQVLFPTFAAMRTEDLTRGFLFSLRCTAVVALPLTATLAVLARALTVATFGRQWLPAIAATQVMCVWALMSPVSMVCGNVLKARGRAVTLLLLAVPQAVALIVGSLLLVHQGIVAVAWLQAAIAVAAQIVTLRITARTLGLGLRPVLTAIAPPATASVLLAAVLAGVDRTVVDPWPTILVGGLIGGVVYLGACHRLMPDLFAVLRGFARPSTGQGPAAPTKRAPVDPPPAVVASEPLD